MSRQSPVEIRLRERHIPHATLILEDLFDGRGRVSYQIDKDGESLLFPEARTGQKVSTAGIRSTWTVSLDVPIKISKEMADSTDLGAVLRTMGHSETHFMTKALIAMLDRRTLFVPRLMQAQRANHKLWQIAIARDTGFHVAPTWCGDRPADLVNRLNVDQDTLEQRRLHYRPFSSMKFKARGKQFVTVDRIVGPETAYTVNNLSTPTLFSNWPDYRRRLLVACVLGKTWTIEVELKDKQINPDITDAIFQHANENLECKAVEPPDPLIELCNRFLAEGDLQYGVFDLLEMKDGRWCFLVFHPCGRLHLFAAAGLPVYDTLIDRLREGQPNVR